MNNAFKFIISYTFDYDNYEPGPSFWNNTLNCEIDYLV